MTTPISKSAKPKTSPAPAYQTKVVVGSERKRKGETDHGYQSKRPALVSSLALTFDEDSDEIYEVDDDDGEDVEELCVSTETRFQLIKDNPATNEYAHLDKDDGSRVTPYLQGYLEGERVYSFKELY